jgi:hypothetical protein
MQAEARGGGGGSNVDDRRNSMGLFQYITFTKPRVLAKFSDFHFAIHFQDLVIFVYQGLITSP